MTKTDLAQKLNEMYYSAQKGEKVSMIHLFGFKYFIEIIECKASAQEIALAADINESYGTEISKGVKDAKEIGSYPKRTIKDVKFKDWLQVRITQDLPGMLYIYEISSDFYFRYSLRDYKKDEYKKYDKNLLSIEEQRHIITLIEQIDFKIQPKNHEGAILCDGTSVVYSIKENNDFHEVALNDLDFDDEEVYNGNFTKLEDYLYKLGENIVSKGSVVESGSNSIKIGWN